jgi:hypothetical protein
MSMYCINTLGGGAGYKVQVADTAGGLRVVGVFSNKDDAKAWIEVDQATSREPAADRPRYEFAEK